ncbi:phosphonopyruvate decarboxylase [Maridesulfovibrio sp.]|uniref:phosphonopyruvate decarboxylase n=1 Tax=Maridesulfovibrio sp. TaxID=2795000 RepID=UPI0029CA400F|nr:phosphonopyruvate decarboxylase [Maridesulfovibrio sp.]
MIDPLFFLKICKEKGFSSFYGVPDSTLKHFCTAATDDEELKHTICVNEGAAVGAAIGYHLSTAGVPVVYMQNSGLGNAVNPLTSLVAKEIYSIPMLLVIGWRGEPGVKDEPQHKFQGRITCEMLQNLEIPFSVIDENSEIESELFKAVSFFQNHDSPYALLIKKGTFSEYTAKENSTGRAYPLSRQKTVECIVKAQTENTVIVATTGMASRELFHTRKENKISHGTDFLTVGGMGHASSIALGIAANSSDKKVICLDGDGACLMHLGAMATIGSSGINNLIHIVINNGEHGSTGGQPTVAREIDLCEIARACGYSTAARVESEETLDKKLAEAENLCFLEVMTNNSKSKDIGRPTSTPLENKKMFMENFR